VGGDILLKLPDGGTITFVSMGLMAFTQNTLTLNFPSHSLKLSDILSQMDDVKEAPVDSVITDEFVKLENLNEEAPKTEQNENFSMIMQAVAPAPKVQAIKQNEEIDIKPEIEAEINDFDAIYKPTDDNPVNVNISEVNNAVEAGLKYTFTAYQTKAFDTVENDVIVRVDGGGGSAYGSEVDTPEAQFQSETLDYSTKKDSDGNIVSNNDNIVIFADSPKYFKTDPNDLDSEPQLSRDLSIKPEQPIGFGISEISISNLPDGFKIVGGTFKNGFWEIPKAEFDDNGNVIKDGFVVD
jgi:hypothetical protein